MRARLRALLLIVLALSIGLGGCIGPLTDLGAAQAAGLQHTAAIEVPAFLGVGLLFFAIDLAILPFQGLLSLLGGGEVTFFPLIGSLMKVLDKIFGDDEPEAKPGAKEQKQEPKGDQKRSPRPKPRQGKPKAAAAPAK